MKYKIGELEVEAVQWNGDNKSEIIDTWPEIKEGISWDHNTLGILWVNNRITYGDYIVKSKDGKFFVLDNQDFNKIATKVKEPKFKVGDKVYYVNLDRNNFISFDLVEVLNIFEEEDYYEYSVDWCSKVCESELLTLEEAIEKLKEL